MVLTHAESMYHDDHDDFGGLHRDLRQTGDAMGRRQLLRLAARFSVGVEALNLVNGGRLTADGGQSVTVNGQPPTVHRQPFTPQP